MLIVIEWFVWALSCAFAAWAFIAFLVEVFWPEPFPSGPKSIYPIPLRRAITALYTLGITAAIVVTAVYDVSKFHLLWFVPLFHFYGTQWIGWLYLSSQKSILQTKTTVIADSDCPLKDFPLLCLYFGNFEEIRRAWQQGSVAVGHDADIRIDEIMGNENLFLELYENKLLRLRLLDGTDLLREDEEYYWDRIVNPEKYVGQLSFKPGSDSFINAELKKLHETSDAKVQAIKFRYGLVKSE